MNSMDWPGTRHQRSTMRLYRNNRNGTFTDVTKAAGLDVEMYGLGVAVGDYDDGFPDIFISCQSRLFRNTGKGTFVDVTAKSGLQGHDGFSTSVWLDYDRDGHLDLFVTNYVKWTQSSDVFCSFDGKAESSALRKRIAEQPAGRNKGDGTFEDVTAKAGLFDTSSKSLGVAMLDYDNDGWLDVFVANDTQPNKLYHNNRNGTFSEVAVKAGLAFGEGVDGRAPAWVWTSRTWTIPGSPRLSSPTSTTKCWVYTAGPRRSFRRSGAQDGRRPGQHGGHWGSDASSSTRIWTGTLICWWPTDTSTSPFHAPGMR